MQFRPLQLADIERAPSWLREIPLREDLWRDPHTRSAIAHDGDNVVAAGIIWTSRVHGDRYWFEITVAPDLRRRGLGREMFSLLSRLRATDLPFIARGYVDEARLHFVRSLGGQAIQIVPPALVQPSAGRMLRKHPSVRPASEVEWAALADSNALVYEWTHASWSPVAPDFASALNEDLADELDLEASSVAVVDGSVAAHCMVYRDSVPPIVTAETVSRQTRNGERLVEGCVRRSLDVLASRGVAVAEFDGHVTDPHFLPVWTRLAPEGSWFHLLEVPAPTVSPADDGAS